MALIRFYSYRDKLVIPTVAQAEEGFFMDVEPVTIYDTTDRNQLLEVVTNALNQTNEVVPTPERSHPYDAGSPILEKLKLKKWQKFEAEAAMYTIHQTEDAWQYHTSGNAVDGLWRPNQVRQMTFKFEKGMPPLVSQIINDIESDVRARSSRGGGGGLALLPPPKS